MTFEDATTRRWSGWRESRPVCELLPRSCSLIVTAAAHLAVERDEYATA
jgi:hypothetical protein